MGFPLFTQQLYVAQKLTDFIAAEDDGKFFFMPGADKEQRWPGAFDGVFIKEFDTAKGDSAGTAFPFPDIFAVQEVISQILFSDPARGFVEMIAQLPNGTDIKLLCAFAVAFKLKVLYHTLS